MEKHTCKQCGRNFTNGRALGGHVRSHVMGNTRRVPPTSPTGSYSSRNDDVESKQVAGYGLRENPKKTIRLLEDPDHVYSTAAFVGDRDYESETESPRAPIQGTRSKRVRNPLPDPFTPEAENGASSVSDATPEEDVAISLMILSRDKWSEYEEEECGYEEDYEAGADDFSPTRPVSKRSRYQCGTCRKVFKSYQALGGHRASHKKGTGCGLDPKPGNEEGGPVQIREEVAQRHECPFCPRVFSSGQALGGHKRIHMLSAAAGASNYAVNADANANAAASNNVEPAVSNEKKFVNFDLNMPAPSEEDAELSEVSDP